MNFELNYEDEFPLLAAAFRQRLSHIIKSHKDVTQSRLGHLMQKSQNAVNNWITMNPKYRCLPNAVDFLILCKILEVNPAVFLDCEISLDESSTESVTKTMQKLAFVPTAVSQEITKIMQHCLMQNEMAVVITIEKNGTTRALEEFVAAHKEQVCHLDEPMSLDGVRNYLAAWFGVDFPEEVLSKQRILLILENADFLNRQQKESIVGHFFHKHPVVFVQKKHEVDDYLFQQDLPKYYLKAISRKDLEALVLHSFPDLSPQALQIFETASRGRIDELSQLILKLHQRLGGKRALSAEQVLAAYYAD